VFRPRRRWLPGRWAIALAAVAGVLAGAHLALPPSGAPPRGAPPPSAVFQRDLPAVVTPPPRSAPGSGGLVITGRASIIDADTIEVQGQRIRLHGIDAPENDQVCERNGRRWRCGQEATAALRSHLGGRSVTCHELDVDRFGRSVARCLVNGQDVGAWMVRNGWAVAYRRFSDAYVGVEAEARAARRGIWSGRFEMPESHRHSGR
jgi:endonuclease YncB( thermonuclease family)